MLLDQQVFYIYPQLNHPISYHITIYKVTQNNKYAIYLNLAGQPHNRSCAEQPNTNIPPHPQGERSLCHLEFQSCAGPKYHRVVDVEYSTNFTAKLRFKRPQILTSFCYTNLN